MLDDLLGQRWDILRSAEQGIRYITCLKVKVAKDLTLTMTVFAAICRQELQMDDYRDTLREDINSSAGFGDMTQDLYE